MIDYSNIVEVEEYLRNSGLFTKYSEPAGIPFSREILPNETQVHSILLKTGKFQVVLDETDRDENWNFWIIGQIDLFYGSGTVSLGLHRVHEFVEPEVGATIKKDVPYWHVLYAALAWVLGQDDLKEKARMVISEVMK